jgi:branched-chain amino acid transport system substrate-binding protein
MRRLLLPVWAVVAVALFPAPLSAETVKPIRIGTFLSVTGQAAFLGSAEHNAIEMLADEVNKSGGVNGRPIELVFYDSKSSAKDAVNIVRRLIDQDDVDLVLGGSTTGETMAVIPFVEEAKVPYMAISGAAVIVQPVKKYVFKTPHTEEMSLEKIYTRASKDGLLKIALLSGAGGYDQSCRSSAKAMAAKFGITLVADEQHGSGDTDMTAQLTNMRSSGADAILYCGFGAPASIVAKNYRQLGIKQRLIMTHGAASRTYIETSDGAAEGSWVTGSALLAYKDLKQDDPIYDITKKFVESYRAIYKEDPGTFAGYGYDALLLTIEAIKKAGSTDKEKLRDALEQLQGVPGTNGVYTFSPTDHLGFSASALRMLEVKDAQFRIAE